VRNRGRGGRGGREGMREGSRVEWKEKGGREEGK